MQTVELKILLTSQNAGAVEDLTRKFKELTGATQQATPALEGFNVKALLAAGSAGAFAAAILGAAQASLTLVQQQGKAAESIANLSDRLGLSIGQTERIAAASELAGVSASAFEGSVQKLSAALEDQGGSGKKAAEALQRLGIATTDNNGAQKEAGQLLLDVAKTLFVVEDKAARTFYATQLLGRGGAKELEPLIKNFTSLDAEVARLGIGVNENLTKKLAAADDEFGKLALSIGQLKKELAAQLEPFVIPIVVSLRQSISNVSTSGALDKLFETQRNNGSEVKSLLNLLGYLTGAPTESLDLSAPGVGDPAGALSKGLVRPGRSTPAKRSPQQVPLRLQDLFAANATSNGRARRGAPSLFSSTEQFNRDVLGLQPDGSFRVNSSDLVGIDGSGQDKAFGDGLLERERQATERRAQLESQILSTRERMIELLAGPGGEVEAARQIRDLRLSTAKDEIEASRANLDYQLRIAEISRRQKDEFRQGLGSTFDALLAGRSGITGYATGFARNIGRTVFQNVGSTLFSGLGNSLRLPGQTGSDGKLNFLGQALQGTPLGVDPMQFATDANTAATQANTNALLAASGIGGGAAGGIGGALGQVGRIFGGASSTNPFIYNQNGKPSVIPVTNELGDIEAYIPAPTKTSSLARGVGFAGALAGGTFGVISGIQQGGARGAVTATGSIAGAASALLSLSGVSGPAAPILAGAALALGLVGSLFPDPKKTRDAAIAREVDSRRFSDFTGTTYSTDTFGRGFDYNFAGDMRPIIINVNAIDASGFVERRDDIAEAVRMAMSEQHPINKEIQSSIIPAA